MAYSRAWRGEPFHVAVSSPDTVYSRVAGVNLVTVRGTMRHKRYSRVAVNQRADIVNDRLAQYSRVAGVNRLDHGFTQRFTGIPRVAG